MSSIRRHKISYKHGLDALAGDSDTTSLVSSAIAELAAAGGGMASKYQASSEAKKKADADKKAYEATHADETAAVNAAQQARKAAAFAQIEAQEALDKANAVEQDPAGPQHMVAKDAAKRAALADAAAKSAEAKVAFYKPTALATAGDAGMKGKRGGAALGSAAPSWMWWALGGIGAVGVGFIGYKMLRGGKK